VILNLWGMTSQGVVNKVLVGVSPYVLHNMESMISKFTNNAFVFTSYLMSVGWKQRMIV